MTSDILVKRLFTTNLLSTGRQWRRAVDTALGQHGISEALAAPLIWISRLGDGVRQIVVASHVGIEGPSLVRLLDQLELLGLVVRKDDPDDRRAKGLWLTDEGKALATRLEEVIDDLRERILRDIDKADLEAAVRVLRAFDALGTSKDMGTSKAADTKTEAAL